MSNLEHVPGKLEAIKLSCDGFVPGEDFTIKVDVPASINLLNCNAYIGIWYANGSVLASDARLFTSKKIDEAVPGQSVQVEFGPNLPANGCIVGLCQSVADRSEADIVKPKNVTATLYIPHSTKEPPKLESASIDLVISGEGDTVKVGCTSVIAPTADSFVAVWNTNKGEHINETLPVKFKGGLQTGQRKNTVVFKEGLYQGQVYTVAYLVNGYSIAQGGKARVIDYAAVAGYVTFKHD